MSDRSRVRVCTSGGAGLRRPGYRGRVFPPLAPDAVRAALAASVGDRIGRVVVVPRTGSTSTDLVEAATEDPQAWPDRSVLVADHQAEGRGRSGRTWQTPPGSALTASVLLRPPVPVDRFGWLPLLGGLAVVRALTTLGVRAVLKWPNDVLVAEADTRELLGWGRHRKVAGVLADLLPVSPADGGPAVVIGIGVNVSLSAEELPVASATSLAVCGVAVDRTELLAAVVASLVELDDRWRAAQGDAVGAGLAAEVAAACSTLGAPVRVRRPGGAVLLGRATGLSRDGALRVLDADGREHTILAGDVEQVRA